LSAAGWGGIAAAVALARAGIDVGVYEQSQQLTEVGARCQLIDFRWIYDYDAWAEAVALT